MKGPGVKSGFTLGHHLAIWAMAEPPVMHAAINEQKEAIYNGITELARKC